MKTPTRAERFRVIRDEVIGKLSRARVDRDGSLRLRCGPFSISYFDIGAIGPGRGYNLNIWPGARIDSGYRLHSHKVCNADWDDYDQVYITSFRSGPWEAELLRLLRSEDGLRFFG